jgi:tartrate dehydratase alpha subunit/fumarate hydratase class I-like protein
LILKINVRNAAERAKQIEEEAKEEADRLGTGTASTSIEQP